MSFRLHFYIMGNTLFADIIFAHYLCFLFEILYFSFRYNMSYFWLYSKHSEMTTSSLSVAHNLFTCEKNQTM